ncbi:MAG: hypothetical protein ABIU05_10705 [Nitrospirales bacterium]
MGAHALRSLGSEYEESAIAISTRFETMGLLVFQRSIPFHLVEQQVGGAIVLLWTKLQPRADDFRAEQKHPLLFEWFQWLAEQMRRRGRPEESPAYDRHKDWSPN